MFLIVISALLANPFRLSALFYCFIYSIVDTFELNSRPRIWTLGMPVAHMVMSFAEKAIVLLIPVQSPF